MAGLSKQVKEKLECPFFCSSAQAFSDNTHNQMIRRDSNGNIIPGLSSEEKFVFRRESITGDIVSNKLAPPYHQGGIAGDAVLLASEGAKLASMGSGGAANSFRWGNPKSRPTYGHTFLEHGKSVKPAQLADRARAQGTQIGQYLDDQAAADFVADVAKRGPGNYDVPLPEGLPTRVVLPDGTEATADMARIIVKPDGSVRTSYPFSSAHPS